MELKRRGRYIPILGFLFIFTVSGRSFAQRTIPDLAEASLEQLGSIEVYTASKHPQKVSEAPSSVTVITAEEIQQHGYRTLADLLQTVRGFFVTNDRNYSSVGVRGFARPGDFNTRILLLVDGHRLNDNVYDEAMIGTEFPVDIDLIQRVEVIRGPVSSLYGSNALFAVVNIITRTGSGIGGLEISSAAGSFNTYDGRISYGHASRDLDLLISGSFYGSRGPNELFFSQFNTPANNYGVASHADDDQAGKALARISYKGFIVQGVFGTREKGIPTGAYETLFNNRGTRTVDSHGYLDLRYEREFGRDWNFVARTFYDRYSYQGTYQYASPLGDGKLDPNLDFADGKWWGTELQVRKTVLTRNHITVGTEYRDNIRQNQSNYDLQPFSVLLQDQRQSYVVGAYVQDELTLTRQLVLNAGFRYDYYSYVVGSVDPRAALIYRPWRRTALKAIYGEAFRIPNVYELHYAVPPNAPNPMLRPEKARTSEFIWEQGFGNRVWTSASFFHNRIDDLINEEPSPDGMLVFRNVQDVASTGAELEIKGQLRRNLEAGASYAFQQTKDRATDSFLSNSPRNLAKLSVSQGLFRQRVFFSLDASYRSRIQSLNAGSESPFTLLNVSLFARNVVHHLDLSASVYNLLNKKYFDPPSSANLHLPIEQDGRSFRVKLTWRWGEQ